MRFVLKGLLRNVKNKSEYTLKKPVDTLSNQLIKFDSKSNQLTTLDSKSNSVIEYDNKYKKLNNLNLYEYFKLSPKDRY